MPALILMSDGHEEKVMESVDVVKKKKLAGGWQPFTTIQGNVCRVNTAKIQKITSLR